MTKFESFKLRFVHLILQDIRDRKIKTALKQAKLIRKSMFEDFSVFRLKFLNTLALGAEPFPFGVNRIVHALNGWLVGPFTSAVSEFAYQYKEAQTLPENPEPSTPPGHETWKEGDGFLSRIEIETLDRLTLLSYGPEKLLKGVYPYISGIPIKRLESKGAKVRSWKIKLILRSLKAKGV